MHRTILFFLWIFGASLFALEEEYITFKTFEKAVDKSFYRSPRLKPEAIQAGEVLHVVNLSQFFFYYHPHISYPYVIVSCTNSYSISKRWSNFLEDEKLIAWFSQNIEFYHPKLHLIPLGLREKQLAILDQYRRKLSEFPKRHLLCMNFSIETYPKERSYVYDLFKDRDYCYVQPYKPFEQYLLDLASARFVLSPRGDGLDCHRTWESLYMGAIPIVKTSPLDSLFEGLPVLIVQEWEEITEEFLLRKYEEMCQGEYAWEKLTPQYWIDKIRSYTSIPME